MKIKLLYSKKKCSKIKIFKSNRQIKIKFKKLTHQYYTLLIKNDDPFYRINPIFIRIAKEEYKYIQIYTRIIESQEILSYKLISQFYF